MQAHRIAVNGILCVDEGRKLRAGDHIEVRRTPLSPAPQDRDVEILHADDDVVVAHKPSGMLTLRHPGDTGWTQARKDRQPALVESLSRLLQQPAVSRKTRVTEQLLAVQRLDRETSGVIVFARNPAAQRVLIRQFASHTVLRRYLCLVPGLVDAQTISTRQIRDRGDGLRGSAPEGVDGLRMVTHVRPLRTLGQWSELECRLETGRTNQIRIHLAELGHPVCGDVKYRGRFGQAGIPDESEVPRLALHAMCLGFEHPETHCVLEFSRPWPADIARWLRRQSVGGP
jgi:23S rRNA pseudouridine1911/1915/1917 synthase